MAFQTVTFNAHNICGNVREDYGTWTDGATSGEVRTRLKWISAVEIMRPGVGNQSYTLFINTDDTTEQKADFGGVFHYENFVNGACRYRAWGR